MTKTIHDVARALVGIPWRKGNEGLDCIGLVVRFFYLTTGYDLTPDLPAYDPIKAGTWGPLLDLCRAKFTWVTPAQAQDGDLLVYGNQEGAPAHVGILLGDRVLHSSITSGAVLVPRRRLDQYVSLVFCGRPSWV